MVQANELRIGNWLMDIKPYEKFITVRPENIIKAANGWDYRPIPLTPEILEKAGFVSNCSKGIVASSWGIPINNGELFFFDPRREEPHVFNMMKYYPNGVEGDGYYFPCKVHSLHQLQNLYFALTGEELIYNPNDWITS